MISAGAYFVAGTDTSVGKTLVSASLLCAARRMGWRTQAFKPVAAGCEYVAERARWENEDAQLLAQFATVDTPYEQMNPCALPDPCSPHIAAQRQSLQLSAAALAEGVLGSISPQADLVLVEGAGGWHAPLSDHETMATLAQNLRLPVILVIGLRLGCLNHAMLTQQAIAATGLPLAGWVACQVEPQLAYKQQNLAWLQQQLGMDPLGVVPWLGQVAVGEERVQAVSDQLTHYFSKPLSIA